MSQLDANVIVRGSGDLQLRAAFTQHAGRFLGGIWLDTAQGPRQLLREVQADEQPWPPSPPWQELHVHQERDSLALLLVGRAGKSHWSMAVGNDTARRAIIFDVACRLRSPPEFLGSTLTLAQQLPTNIRLDALAIDNEPAPTVTQTDGQVVVRPILEITPPATIRWKFGIALAE